MPRGVSICGAARRAFRVRHYVAVTGVDLGKIKVTASEIAAASAVSHVYVSPRRGARAKSGATRKMVMVR